MFVALCVATVVVVVWTVRDDGGDREDAAPPKRAAAATSTTLAVRTPTAADPLRILVAGDSLVGWIAPALEQELPGTAPVEVIDDWKGSSGLVRPDFFDWPARIETDMAQHDPDVVVLGFGGNDTQGITTDDGVLALGTPEWQAEYQRRIAKVLDFVEAPGRTVVWIGLPLTTSEPIESLRPVLTRALKAELRSRPWARFVDTRDALAPDGTFTSRLPDDDGQLVVTMAPDEIHPSLEGGIRIVREFLPELLQEHRIGS
jgi:hypothetical protein